MTEIYESIKETAVEKFNRKRSLPSFFHTTLYILERGHLYWWMFKDYTLLKRAEGAVLDFLSDYSLCLRIALIAKCTEDLLFQYKKLYYAYQNLNHVINAKFPIYERYNWSEFYTDKKISYCSSFYLNAKLQCDNFLKKTKMILKCSWIVLKELFILSAQLNEIQLIANGNSFARLGAYTDLADKWPLYLKKISDDQLELLKELTKLENFIDSILIKINLNKNTSQLISFMTKQVGQTIRQLPRAVETVENILEPIYTSGKIVPIQLGFQQSQSKNIIQPALYPPWTGQSFKMIEF